MDILTESNESRERGGTFLCLRKQNNVAKGSTNVEQLDGSYHHAEFYRYMIKQDPTKSQTSMNALPRQEWRQQYLSKEN